MKRKALLVAFAVALVAIISIGTFAYFTDVTEPKTNAFVAAGDEYKVNIDLTENAWDPQADHVIVPGAQFAKDPTITIREGTADAWVKFEAVISNAKGFNSIDELKAALIGLPEAAEVQFDPAAGTGTITYIVPDKLTAASPSATLFTSVKFDGSSIDSNDVANLDGFTIEITGYAIQADAFASAEAAFAAVTEFEQIA